MLTKCCSYLKRAKYICMCSYTRKRWFWAKVACKKPLVTNCKIISTLLWSPLALIYIKHTSEKGSLPPLKERWGTPGETVGLSSKLNPGNHPKTQKERLVRRVWIARDRQEERRKEGESSQKIPSEGKSLKYSPEKAAVETSTHTSEAEGSKHSLTSNSTSTQFLAVASSGPTGK